MISQIIKLLPSGPRGHLTRFRDGAKLAIASVSSRSKIASYLVYITNAHFFADFSAFNSGASLYSQRSKSSEPNTALLRRNIHRIEKGMCFPSRRHVFALSYIRETVIIFDQFRKRSYLQDRSEFAWANDNLTQYFDITESNEKAYIEAKNIFLSVDAREGKSCPEIPIQYRNTSRPEDFDNFMALLRQRKSVREYVSEQVPEEVLQNALEAASLAPSSCNRQPYQYYILNEPTVAQKAAAISVGTEGWIGQIQCLAVVVGDASQFSNSVNRHSIYVDSTLSIIPFILSLETQGFSTCLINWADDHSRRSKMTSLLNLKPHQRVVLSVSIGRADITTRVPFSKRKFWTEISNYD